MEKDSYFQDALARFTHEVASAGAIRHLVDIGYTVKQIREQLDFPVSYAQVQREVWECLMEKGVILREEPGSGRKKRKTGFVREYDRFGKATFRQIAEPEEAEKVTCWKEHLVETRDAVALLRAMREENGEENSYGSCDFGLLSQGREVYGRKSSETETFTGKIPGIPGIPGMEAWLEILDPKQLEYVTGLPWEGRRVYHRLDGRMTEILLRLYEAGLYQGEWYFLRTQEKAILLPLK